MAPLTDPARITAYLNALSNWRFSGFIRFTEPAERWIRRELGNISAREFGRLMWEHVESGREIDAVVERRSEWAEHKYHYDLRLKFDKRLIYVETRLFFDDPADPDGSTILVVSVHDP